MDDPLRDWYKDLESSQRAEPIVADTSPIDLWLDDIRDPARHGCIGWTWVTTAAAAIDLLKTGRVQRASLDHDLNVEQTMGMPSTEPTGYTVVCWMEEHDVWPPQGVTVHSQNPVGRARMRAAIDRHYS